MTIETKSGVLFVDDEINFLSSIQRILRISTRYWDEFFASSADEALVEVQTGKIDVVVTDIHMPGKDGFDLIRAMQANPATLDIPIIVLTGSGETHLKSKALTLGATDLLNKPIDSTELFARIQNTLKLKLFQDQIKNQNKILEERVRERTAELEDARLDILWRLAKAGEQRDDDTGNHVVRVANYCRLLAGRLGLAPEHTRLIFLTSPLHDIGKIGIPDRILLKRGRLTMTQKETMNRHSEIGADILLSHPNILTSFLEWDTTGSTTWKPQDNPLLKLAASIASTHHEWWDGSGYPRRLSGESIPLESRIVAIADVYDALRSPRSYKPAFSPERTLKIMRKEAKNHFDPKIFAIFEGVVDDFHMIWEKYGSRF